MKILVTGATGFVGAHLAEALADENEVFIFARSGSAGEWRLTTFADRIAGRYDVDLLDRAAVFSVVREISPEAVLHLATYGGLPREQDRKQTVDLNIHGTMNIVDAALAAGSGTFINTGSSSEYGIKNSPMREDDCCNPVNLYGISKLAATNYCSMICREAAMRVCTVRLFSPYGKYEDPLRLYPAIVTALAAGVPPKLANPHSVRDFIAVERVVTAYRRLLHAQFVSGAIFNLGSGNQQTVAEFYRSVAAAMGKEGLEPVWGAVEPRKNEPVCWEADVTQLRSVIGDF